MPTFSYKAKDQKGSIVNGTMDADARQGVVTRLQQMGYFPMSIQQSDGSVAIKQAPPAARNSASKTAVPKLPPAPAASTSARMSKSVALPKMGTQASSAPAPSSKGRKKKISSSDIATLNRQLADLIGSGIPLVKALGILQKQAENPALREIMTSILDEVQGGATFADALTKHPTIFSRLYVAMVKSGEAGGMLDDVLGKLADLSEAEEQLKGRVLSALAYPAVMVLVGIGAVIFMLTFVIPKITATFSQLGQALPWITQVLIAASGFIQSYWWIVIIAIVFIVVAARQYIATAEGKLAWHRAQLNLPILGIVVQKREVARFARTLGSLLRNGVSILSALDIVREVLDNVVVKGEVDKIVDAITQGSSIASPLRESAVFPPVAVNMISIGEETGRLPDVLLRISDSFEVQVDRSVRTLTSLLEPIIIVTLGFIVGFIVIAMLLPIFSLDPSGGGN